MTCDVNCAQDKWRDAFAVVEGIKVKNDPKVSIAKRNSYVTWLIYLQLVAKTIKRKEKAKESSRKKWDKRIKDQVIVFFNFRVPCRVVVLTISITEGSLVTPRTADEAGSGTRGEESCQHFQEKQQVSYVACLHIALFPLFLLRHRCLLKLVAAWSKPRRRNREHVNKCPRCQGVVFS